MQNDPTKQYINSAINAHLDYIEDKNYKMIAYLFLAENYFYDKNYTNSIRAYKKLMQLAWKD